MYWLRRIPAETRFVVLVVFLALFQSILLSVFGLLAIQGERRQVEDQARARADQLLRDTVATPAQNALRDHAEEVWADPRAARRGALFTDAFGIRADGAILDPEGFAVYLPPGALARDREAARVEASTLVEAFARGETAEDDKALADLAFARRHPFYEEAPGDARALLFAATPLFREPRRPGFLLEARWIGVLNRVARYLPEPEIERFLRRVDAGGAGGKEYAEGAAEQDRRARVLDALRREAPRLSPTRLPSLHPSEPPFYVRARGGEGEAQALAADRERLRDFLNGVAARSSARGIERARIVQSAAAPEPFVALRDLPGWFATANISDHDIEGKAWGRAKLYWYIIGFSVAGILAGGFLTARAVMREVKLAKLKSDFVSNVSHELKTPLTSIRMFSEMLRSGKVTDAAEREECLGVISQESERLGTLIQRVLDFSRLQARRRGFRFETAPLGPAVERETERFRRAAGLPAEEFVVEVEPGLPPARHDPEAIAEVVSNLLSNAAKYSPAEGRRIRLSLARRGGGLLLAVEDNGPGVPAGERLKIFEPFYRAGDLLTREVEGTGLGLSIVRDIVRAHGGKVGVEDRPGGGARFLVLLPAGGGSA